MHQAAKKGAVVRPDQPWEVWLQTRCAPAWDPNQQLFKLWLSTCPPDPSLAGPSYAESKDGIHWTKPILRQVEYQGSKENNFLSIAPKLRWGNNYLETVLFDPNDPNPSCRYKGLLGAEYRIPVVSPDGIHWTRLNVSRLASGDEGNLSYDPLTRTFIATLKTFTASGRCARHLDEQGFQQVDKAAQGLRGRSRRPAAGQGQHSGS